MFADRPLTYLISRDSHRLNNNQADDINTLLTCSSSQQEGLQDSSLFGPSDTVDNKRGDAARLASTATSTLETLLEKRQRAHHSVNDIYDPQIKKAMERYEPQQFRRCKILTNLRSAIYV